FCFRLRQQGWKILRLRAEMALHDSAMTRFGQWWRRAVRCGHAYAQGAQLHGGSPERHYVRETRRAWAWGFLIPTLAMCAAWPSGGVSLLLLLLYPAQLWRIYRQARHRPLAPAHAAAYAVSCVISKFAEVYGVWKFGIRQLRGGPMQLIEHK